MTAEKPRSVRREMLEARAEWELIFSEHARTEIASPIQDPPKAKSAIAAEHRTAWVDQLFQGLEVGATSSGKTVISKQGTEIHEVFLDQLPSHAVIGRHPDCHIQLEAYKLGLFHAVLLKRDGGVCVESIEVEFGTLLNRKRIATGNPLCCTTSLWSMSPASSCASASRIRLPHRRRTPWKV
jgi:hypothetical protein